MLYKKTASSKLFYGKWPYKVICRVEGAWTIRYGSSYTQDVINGKQFTRNINKSRLKTFIKLAEPFLIDTIKKRCESSICTFYCADSAIYNEIKNKLEEFIIEVVEPTNQEELDFLTNNTARKVVCDHLPHKLYRYKISIKANTPANIRNSFNSWIGNYGENVRTSHSTDKWFTSLRNYGQPFIYVKDSPMLSMVSMFLGGNISKIEEYVPRSSINTSIDQEQPCPP
jgi:Pyruvate/2-oxoacid:ferredoxin oxidoreductase delta subunit